MDDEFLEDEDKLASLLTAGQLFCNSILHDGEYKLVLYVICNDIFYWAYADAESFSTSDIDDLYDAWSMDPLWGTAKWCCERRNMQPQAPVKRDMIKAGSWNVVMESLPLNPDSIK